MASCHLVQLMPMMAVLRLWNFMILARKLLLPAIMRLIDEKRSTCSLDVISCTLQILASTDMQYMLQLQAAHTSYDPVSWPVWII